jgi:Fe-S cluster biogenesis protein NfuA
MDTLGIAMIHANSPQAKGRVERLFETLQDRLVKELRLQNISSMESGNAFLSRFLETHNNKFAVEPTDPVDMHRPLRAHENLKTILSLQEERFLSKTLTCQYQNIVYQIETKQSAYIMSHAKVLVVEAQDGTVALHYKGQALSYSIVKVHPKTIDADAKQINQVVDKIKARQTSHHKPAPNHPWRRYSNKNLPVKEMSLTCQG